MIDMNGLLRRRGFTLDAGADNAAVVNAAIRSALGGEPAPTPAPQQTGNDRATEAQLAAARAARLPDAVAHRLEGDDLAADARTLADLYERAGGELMPAASFDGGTRSTPREPAAADMSAQIRQAAANRKAFGGNVPLDEHEFIPTDRSIL